ncbi:RIO1 family-domain-containing protein [Irpex lacteus]|nr:RIO1 family-domain-containing protein [Irpex lacteus]
MESKAVESSLRPGIVFRAPPSRRPYVSTAACSPFPLCGTFRVALGDSYRTEPEKDREEDVEGWGDTAGGVGAKVINACAFYPAQKGQVLQVLPSKGIRAVAHCVRCNCRLRSASGHTYIDEEGLLEWSSDSSEEDEFDLEEDENEAAAFDGLRAEDEDWEIAERDFTKQYNRLRQHVAVRTGDAQGTTSSLNHKTAVASLPAVNRPKQAKQAQGQDRKSTPGSLQVLFADTEPDLPYDLGVGVNRKGPSATANMKDKSDRATTEQVLDPRTRIILFKMIGRGLLYEVNGCVSTGKEVGVLLANVYHALTPERRHLALKIYKTSILVFKDRDRYVSGEYRFRRGYSRHNPRKMVRVWAEKEMRNLKRLQTANIRCPEPIEVRENVLVMGFIGDAEGCSSRIRSRENRNRNTTSGRHTLGHLYIIDVSQSVEHDHPHAFDFLRSDLRNVEDFFSKRGVRCLGLRRAFEFVTKDSLDDEAKVGTRCSGTSLQQDQDDDEADRGRWRVRMGRIQVYDPERDVGVLNRGEGEGLIYKDTIGIVAPKDNKVRFEDDGKDEEDGSTSGEEEDEEEGSDEEGEGEDGQRRERRSRGHRNEDKEAKKERKKAVKAEARERRKNKIPKAEKKKKIKATARGK